MRHTVETCPDNLDDLRAHLNGLGDTGARVISVIWQARRVEDDQAGAYDTSGSFVIVSERPDAVADPLRPRPDVAALEEIVVPAR